ncbi:MAG: hypothetical protein ACRDA3_14040 [Peptostreptococcaceae bacterium]
MDRFFSVLLLVAMFICIISFNIFRASNQLVFVLLSIFGISFSLGMLIWSSKKYLNKYKK